MSTVTSRVSWSVGGQTLSSGTNFALAYIVARELGFAELGAFALAFAFYTFTVEVVRATGVEVLAMEMANEPQLDDLNGVASTATFLGVVVAVPLAIVGLLLNSVTGSAFVAMALFLTSALVQDTVRNALIAIGRAKTATLSDIVWVLVQISTFVVVLGWSTLDVSSAITAWGLAAAAAAVVGVRLAGITLSWRSARQWMATRSETIRPLVLEAVGRVGLLQITTVMIVLILTVSELGRLRAAEMLFGPVATLVLAVPHLAVPEAARTRTAKGIHKVAVAASAIPALSGMALFVTIIAIPDSLGTLILAENWTAARQLVYPAAGLTLGSAAVIVAFVGLRAHGRVNDTLKLRIFGGVLVLVLGVSGALFGGITLAAWAIASARLLTAAAAWRTMYRLLNTPTPEPLETRPL